MLESNPLKSIMLVGILGVPRRWGCSEGPAKVQGGTEKAALNELEMRKERTVRTKQTRSPREPSNNYPMISPSREQVPLWPAAGGG